jgi:hypothetical protein
MIPLLTGEWTRKIYESCLLLHKEPTPAFWDDVASRCINVIADRLAGNVLDFVVTLKEPK